MRGQEDEEGLIDKYKTLDWALACLVRVWIVVAFVVAQQKRTPPDSHKGPISKAIRSNSHKYSAKSCSQLLFITPIRDHIIRPLIQPPRPRPGEHTVAMNPRNNRFVRANGQALQQRESLDS